VIAPFTTQLSGTSIEGEYRALAASLARVATPARTFDARAYDPRSLARARAHWSRRMIDEYTSTTVFGALAAQLMEANAPLDTTAVALRMGQDELVHAEACARVVTALGGEVTRMRDTGVIAIARHPGCSAEERAIRNVVFATCISEMNSVCYFVASLEAMTDPYLREVSRQLLADEVLHGSFGFLYLEACTPWLEAHPGAAASIARYLRYGFAVAEREFTRGEHTVADVLPDDSALGLVSPAQAAEIFRSTMTEAVVPGLERFGIPAAEAWRARALAA
jgi:hypothetical protein